MASPRAATLALDSMEDAHFVARLRCGGASGLLGRRSPVIGARPSRTLHRPQDASGLDNLIQAHTTPAERGCTLVALAYILIPDWGVPQTAGFPSSRHAHTRTRARTHTHIRLYRAGGSRPMHVCALHASQTASVSLAATSYNLLPLNLLTLRCRVALHFARQLQLPKVCGPQALPRAAARPEHRTLGRCQHPRPGAYCRRAALGGGGGGRTRDCLAPLWSECCTSRRLNLDRRSPARQVRRVERGGAMGRWGRGQRGESRPCIGSGASRKV